MADIQFIIVRELSGYSWEYIVKYDADLESLKCPFNISAGGAVILA